MHTNTHTIRDVLVNHDLPLFGIIQFHAFYLIGSLITPSQQKITIIFFWHFSTQMLKAIDLQVAFQNLVNLQSKQFRKSYSQINSLALFSLSLHVAHSSRQLIASSPGCSLNDVPNCLEPETN